MDGSELGLRERKRRQTRRELEEAVLTLVVRDGLDKTTIEAISERANVSPRTFFNYFDSKEDALLGFSDVEISDKFIDSQMAKYKSCDKLTQVVGLMVGLIGPSLIDPELHKLRRKIIQEYPRLLERQINRQTHVTRQLSGVVIRVVSRVDDQPIAKAEASVLIGLCISGVQVAIQEWISQGDKVSLPKLEKRAIQIIKEVVAKIWLRKS